MAYIFEHLWRSQPCLHVGHWLHGEFDELGGFERGWLAVFDGLSVCYFRISVNLYLIFIRVIAFLIHVKISWEIINDVKNRQFVGCELAVWKLPHDWKDFVHAGEFWIFYGPRNLLKRHKNAMNRLLRIQIWLIWQSQRNLHVKFRLQVLRHGHRLQQSCQLADDFAQISLVEQEIIELLVLYA